jgi:exosortase
MTSSRRLDRVLGFGLLLGLLGAYWLTLGGVVQRWMTDPKYSHGYLVPLFAAWLLWRRARQSGAAPDAAPGSWWGLPILAAGVAVHLAGLYVFADWLSEVSLLVCLAGLCVCVGGWPLARLAAPAIGFLAFMLPLPYRVEVSLAGPLQSLATNASAYLLQMLGFTAGTEGNVIVMSTTRLGVEDVCSGLGMLVTFFALSTAVAIVLHRPWLDKLVIVASAIPIALAANILRIVVTGILADTVGSKVAHFVFHDLAGLLMTPLGLGLMWVELKVLSRLLVEAPAEAPGTAALALSLTAPARDRTAKLSAPRRAARATRR